MPGKLPQQRALIEASEQIHRFDGFLWLHINDIKSATIGEIDITDCVSGHSSVWAIDNNDMGKEQWRIGFWLSY